MGQIKKIEIVCLPCHKCELLKQRIEVITQCLEFKYHTRIRYEFIHCYKRKEVIGLIARYGYTINQLPITLINGEICFIGHIRGENVIRWKLEEIMKTE